MTKKNKTERGREKGRGRKRKGEEGGRQPIELTEGSTKCQKKNRRKKTDSQEANENTEKLKKKKPISKKPIKKKKKSEKKSEDSTKSEKNMKRPNQKLTQRYENPEVHFRFEKKKLMTEFHTL